MFTATRSCPRQRASTAVQAASRQPQTVKCMSGFGKSNKKAATVPKKKVVDLAKELKENSTVVQKSASPAPDLGKGNWLEMATLDSFPAGKSSKIVELAAGQVVVLFKHKDKVYCSDAYSTAYKYPLFDGKITDEAAGPAIEVPLDGTVYDLATGKVLKWCPNDNPVRAVLGTLKKVTDPVDLPVYPVFVTDDGKIYVNYKAQAAGVSS